MFSPLIQKLSRLKNPYLFTNEFTRVKKELESTHEFDDDYILVSPLNKSTQVWNWLKNQKV